MTKPELYEALDYTNASREKRKLMALKIEHQPQLIPLMLDIIQDNHDPISCKASWILEYITKNNLRPVLRNIDVFTRSLPLVHLESSIRPAAKICELLIKAYFAKKSNPTQIILTSNHLNAIAEVAFDWLIGKHKVASQAYSMTTLLLLGRKMAWIHPELQLVLQQNYTNGSAAYKARARMTLEALGKIKKD